MKYLILHDGTLEGDCSPDPVDFTKLPKGKAKLSLKEAIALYFRNPKNAVADQDGKKILLSTLSDEEVSDYGYPKRTEIKGGWIINEKTKKLMEKICLSTNTGGDSAVYQLQRILKVVANELAIKKFGKLKEQIVISSNGIKDQTFKQVSFKL